MKLFDAFRPKSAPAPAAAVVPSLVSYQFNAPRVRPSSPEPQGGWASFGWDEHGEERRAVDHQAALRVATIYACMDVVASALSSSDWNVYRGVRGEDRKEALPTDRLHYLLNTRFNPEMTAQAGKRAQLMAALGWGTGYAEIEWDEAGRPRALWPLHPERCELMRDFDGTGRLYLRVTQGWRGGMVDLDMADVFCIRGGGLLGFAGDDKISIAMRTVIGAIALDEFQNAYFGNNAQLGTVFIHKGTLEESERARTKEQLARRHGGARRAFTTGLFTGEWDIKTFGSNAEQAAVGELKNLSVEEICRWFRVPPHKVAHLQRSTNNNIEHQGLEFSRDTLRPWKVEIEQEGEYKLFGARANKFLELDLDWAEQGDYKSRAEAYSIYRNMGVFSANDVLRKLGENTIGSEGDIRIVQGANVRLEDVGAAYDSTKNANEPSAPTEGNAPVAAWLTAVYARIQARRDNQELDLERAGHKDARERARQNARLFAERAVVELKGHVDLDAAKHWALEVVNGAEPAICAVCALKGKP